VPPIEPVHVQFHGPLPATLVGVPLEHKLLVGAWLAIIPLAEPQTPLIAAAATPALHVETEPPFVPVQVQLHGPVPETADGAPALQRLLVGAFANWPVLAAPQTPLATRADAEQLAVEPPVLPSQVHDHGPVPDTDDAVPLVHKLPVGALAKAPPLAEPQLPSIAARLAEHGEVRPPLNPLHVQLQGPAPLNPDITPDWQKSPEGRPAKACPPALPQMPSMGTGPGTGFIGVV